VTSLGQDLSGLLPGYAFERELGRGAMGVVFLARHESLGRSVAVKELQGALAADPATRSRFVVEAKVMASLDHPHVVPVYDFVERDDRCVLVMEQLPGGTVWDQFVSDGMTMPRAMAITLATCSAMQHAHERGVLHRDIKPENLMFDGAGSMKVTDFGIARVVNGASTRATAAGSVLGTPAYMAPEQAEGGDIGPAVDVYAAATMLYEMLSGRLPFEQTDSLTAMLTQRILHDPTPLATVAPHVPEAIAVATMRGLERSPKTRTASAEQLGVDLARAAAATWGPSWLDAAGLTVAGSDAIEQAARAAGPVGSAGGARATVLPGAVPAPTDRITSDTVVGAPTPASTGDDDTPSEPATDTSGPAGEPAPETPAEPTAPTPAIDAVTVKPKASDRDVGRAKADEIDQLIDISEILKSPSRPVAQYLIAAVLFVAGLAWAVVGGGTTDPLTPPSTIDIAGIQVDGVAISTADEPIEIDLNEMIDVSGLEGRQVVSIEFEQFGLPIGDAPTELTTGDLPTCCAGLDPGFIGRITSGAVDATLVLEDPTTGSPTPVATFDVTGTNPWYLTAAGIISMILVLFGAASIESYLRAFRRGRGRIATFAGLVVGGAIFGAAAAVAATIIFGTARGPIAIAGPAALCACGALALGLATRANRKRRRAARQELRHTAIKALASSGR
jgi:serine/threonine-protein kinase